EELLLTELSLMSDDVLVEYVLQEDYYTPPHWEAVAQLELDRRGKSELPKQRTQARCQHGRVFRDGDTCRACGKTGLL
ncbi:MAG TPA: hypothetical protein VI197_30195, partial [Polyangiaceae bacterium]